jgi:hypothetical protein
LSLFESGGRIGLKISDDTVSIFFEEIASATVPKAPKPIESFINVPIQVFTEALMRDVEFIANVFVIIA